MTFTLETAEKVRQIFGPCTALHECNTAADLVRTLEEENAEAIEEGYEGADPLHYFLLELSIEADGYAIGLKPLPKTQVAEIRRNLENIFPQVPLDATV